MKIINKQKNKTIQMMNDFNPEEKTLKAQKKNKFKSIKEKGQQHLEDKENSNLKQKKALIKKDNHHSFKKSKVMVKELFDIKKLDIDRIDFIEDMKDREQSEITNEMFANDIDNNQSEEDQKDKPKNAKKLKKEKSLFTRKQLKAVSSISIPFTKAAVKKEKSFTANDNDDSSEAKLSIKQKWTNKFELL